MTSNRVLVLLVVAAALVACEQKSGPVNPPDTTVTPPPPPPPQPPPPPPPPPGPPTVSSVQVSPAYKSVSAGGSTVLTATLRDSAGNTLTGRSVTWTSSDNAVATVSSAGTVTAVAPGVAIITASSGTKTGIASISVPMAPSSAAIDHVVILIEENTEYGNVIGNPVMPYLNALAAEYGLATEYYGNTHPSIGNYFAMTTGVIVTNDNNFNGTVDTNNVVRELARAGRTWKSYAEGLPGVGYLGQSGNKYTKRHNPFAFFTDVVNDSVQRRNLVPFTQFLPDLGGPGLPNYSFIVPNLCSDGHDCSLSVVDDWLHDNIGPLFRNPRFQRSGALMITFDEGTTSLNRGGRIAWIMVSPRARRGYRSSAQYNHPSMLRLSLELLGVNSIPNGAGSAPSLAGFLTP